MIGNSRTKGNCSQEWKVSDDFHVVPFEGCFPHGIAHAHIIFVVYGECEFE